MEKFIILWECGFGPGQKIIEAESEDDAEHEAYEAGREEFEANIDYKAVPYNEDNCDRYGLDFNPLLNLNEETEAEAEAASIE